MENKINVIIEKLIIYKEIGLEYIYQHSFEIFIIALLEALIIYLIYYYSKKTPTKQDKKNEFMTKKDLTTFKDDFFGKIENVEKTIKNKIKDLEDDINEDLEDIRQDIKNVESNLNATIIYELNQQKKELQDMINTLEDKLKNQHSTHTKDKEATQTTLDKLQNKINQTEETKKTFHKSNIEEGNEKFFEMLNNDNFRKEISKIMEKHNQEKDKPAKAKKSSSNSVFNQGPK